MGFFRHELSSIGDSAKDLFDLQERPERKHGGPLFHSDREIAGSSKLYMHWNLDAADCVPPCRPFISGPCLTTISTRCGDNTSQHPRSIITTLARRKAAQGIPSQNMAP
jgi:hypothetical protein